MDRLVRVRVRHRHPGVRARSLQKELHENGQRLQLRPAAHVSRPSVFAGGRPQPTPDEGPENQGGRQTRVRPCQGPSRTVCAKYFRERLNQAPLGGKL